MAVQDELQALIEQLKNHEISKEEYERRSSELIESIGSEINLSESDSSVSHDRIRAAERMAKAL